MARPQHLKYFEDVLSGKIVACKWIKKLAKRQLDLHANPGDKWVFIEEEAAAVRRFIRLLPHVEGDEAARGELFNPEPWQDALVSELYGWREKGNTGRKKYRQVICQVAKKNGKTFLAAAIALYELLFANPGFGNKIHSAATMREQASLSWDVAAAMVKQMDSSLVSDVKVTGKAISLSNGVDLFSPVSREAKNLEGKNVSFAIFDESALIDKQEVYSNIRTGMIGRRGRAWELHITTAQGKLVSVYMSLRKLMIQVLEGILDSDRYEHVLPFLYETDEGCDPFEDEECWAHANPNLGVSVLKEDLRIAVQTAKDNPREKPEVANKHFNMWVSDYTSWLDIDAWDACKEESDGDVVEFYLGVDLASTQSLCAVTKLDRLRSGKFRVGVKTFISDKFYNQAKDELKNQYRYAKDRGELVVTPGNVTDLDAIEEYVIELLEDRKCKKLAADPYHAQHMINRLEKTYPKHVFILKQNYMMLNQPIHDLEEMVLNKQIEHDGSNFLRWQFLNVRIKKDPKTKMVMFDNEDEQDHIDSFSALVNAVKAIDEGDNIFAESPVKFFSFEEIMAMGKEEEEEGG